MALLFWEGCKAGVQGLRNYAKFQSKQKNETLKIWSSSTETQILKQKSPNRREAETYAPNKGTGTKAVGCKHWAAAVTWASLRSPRERTVQKLWDCLLVGDQARKQNQQCNKKKGLAPLGWQHCFGLLMQRAHIWVLCVPPSELGYLQAYLPTL